MTQKRESIDNKLDIDDFRAKFGTTKEFGSAIENELKKGNYLVANYLIDNQEKIFGYKTNNSSLYAHMASAIEEYITHKNIKEDVKNLYKQIMKYNIEKSEGYLTNNKNVKNNTNSLQYKLKFEE